MIKRVIIITLVLGISALVARAQKIEYGVKISGGFAYQQIRNKDILSAGSIKTFNLRGIAQMPLGKRYWIEGSLGYLGKGSVMYNDALTTTKHLNYGELSLSALRKLTFTNLGVFYLGAGPYVAMGLNGTLDYETPGSDTKDNIKFGKDYDAKRFDAGLNFSTGFEFRNRVTFNIGYALGLNNIASIPQQDSGTSVIRNREFLIGLGYRFK
jgi:hypothetical protein